MASSKLVDYLKLVLLQGYSQGQITEELKKSGWTDVQINEGIKEIRTGYDPSHIPTPPPASKTTEWDIDIKKITPAQIFLNIGGLIVFLAGVIYIFLNWQEWNSFLRISAIFLPMVLMFFVGSLLWSSQSYKKYALIFLTVGGLLIPLFLSILLRELQIFNNPLANEFILIVSAISLGSYVLLSLIFPAPIWVVLGSIASVCSYYNVLRLIGVKSAWESNVMSWLFLPLGVIYGLLGAYFERKQKIDYSHYFYLFSTIVLFGSLVTLALRGDIFGLNTNLYSDNQDLRAWSVVIIGLFYFGITAVIAYLPKLNLKQPTEYLSFFNFLGTLFVLGGVFLLGLNGKKIMYETLLLFSSLGAIFLSTIRLSTSYLYLGTLFLIIYIFSIGGEYFQNQIGWPLTLLVSGLLSMAVGLAMEKLKRKYFKKTITSV